MVSPALTSVEVPVHRVPAHRARPGWVRIGPWQIQDRVLLLGVALGYAAAQLLFLRLGRYLAYDEAVYLSQVAPGVAPQPFTAPRARGLPWLLLPVAGQPLLVIRVYLVAVHSALLLVAFRAWLPVLRARAVAAAALFASLWLTQFLGGEIFPNLLAALGGVAAAGYLAQHLTAGDPAGDRPGRRTGVPAACAVAVCLVAVVRPTEATFLTLGLALAAVTRDLRATLVRWTALGLGLALGWLPWVVEAFQRFGGPVHRLGLASSNVHGGFTAGNVLQHLALTDGPLSGDPRAPVVIPWTGVAWWLVVVGLVLLALVRRGSRAGTVAALVTVCLAAQYLLFTTVVEARFLVPAYALSCVVVAARLPARPSRRRRGLVTAWAVVAALLAGFVVQQHRALVRVDRRQYAVRHESEVLADEVLRRSGGRSCWFASEFGFPVIAVGSRCTGTSYVRWRGLVAFARPPGSEPVIGLSISDPTRGRIVPVPGSVRRFQVGRKWWYSFVIPPAAVRAA